MIRRSRVGTVFAATEKKTYVFYGWTDGRRVYNVFQRRPFRVGAINLAGEFLVYARVIIKYNACAYV